MATSLYPFTTTWTGAGDGTNWSDPANWSNGVPLPSAPATDASQDIATIDNSVDTAPFGLVIAGSQSAGEIDLNVTDPASGPAVSLTGTLNMSTNVQPTGSGFGHINLTSGTFEIDGGTLEGAEVTEKGGTLTFGGASPITLGGDIIDGNVAIDNGVTVVMAASNGAVFDGVGGYGTATDVTISGGATLSTVGSIYLSGEIDVQAGGTLSLDGGPLYGWGSSGTFFADGGTVNVTNSFSVSADYIFEGEVNFAGAETISVAQGGELTFGVAPATPTAPTVIDLKGSTIDVTGALNLVNTVLENGTVILEAGSTYTADATSSATLTDNRPAGQTNWTGAAGDDDWSNAGNWTNGVPQSGLGFTTDGQSVAVINNVIDAAPSTIVIAGSVNAQDIYLNTADPAGGPSVSLTGTLDTSYGGEGGAYGYLDLTSGTFEIDGGSLNYTGVGLNGGTLAFGSTANGAEFLNTDIVNGDFTINGSEVLLDGYNVFHGQGGGGPSTTTLTGGAQLIEASGTLAIDGTLDIQDGGDSTLFALDGGNLSGYGDEGATIFIDGGTFAIDASTTFSNTVNIYGGYMVIGETDAVPVITIDSSSVTSIGQAGGAQTVVNLDGGTLDVFGTLNLTNTYIENGTITVEAGATFNQDSSDTLEGVTVQGGLQTATNWTGGGDGTSWTDANNWDNGVPVAGGPYDTLGQNVTTIDNTHGDASPFTVVLTGDQAGALVIVDATDPTDGVAVRIEGSLNLGFDGAGGSITLGVLDANGGTVEIDGGTLDVLNINQLGGQVTFGSFAQWGAATLNASGIAGDLTIGNASELIIAANSFGAFNNAAQGTANTVTITDNSTLDIQGSLYSTNTINIVSGSVILDGGSLGMGTGTKLVSEGGGLSVNGSGTLNTLEYDGAVSIGQNNTLTIASGQTTLISNPGGQYAIALDGGNLQVLGTLDADGIITGTGTLALGAGATLMDATVNAPVQFDDPTIQINGNATLDNVTIDAPIDFAPGAVLTIAGTETFGNAADSTPMMVDLNGGVLDVTGTLDLTNTDISNGTVILESGATLTTDAASALTNVTVEQTLANGDQQIIGQNVAITSLQAVTTTNSVIVETGVDGSGTATGTPGEVTFNDPTDSNNPVGFTGAGTVTVTDGNGLSNTDFNGATLDADVSGQTLAVITDTYSANYGSFTVSNGGALVIGDAAHESANLVGGVLNAGLSATGGSSVLFYGANGISVVNGQITLDGSSSIGVAAASGTVTLAQSLTSIGSQNPTTYLDQLGILNLNNGASFIDPNAVTLYGEINLTGGTLSTGGLTGNLVVFNNGFGGDLASGVTGYGTLDGAFGSTSGDIYMDASGGTLTYTGALAGFDNLEASTNSELIVNSAINADGNANGYDVTLQSGSTVDLTGQLVNTNGLYVNFSGSNATLILNDPVGVALNSINVANAVTGDVIDLAGLVAATGTGGAPDVTITRTSPGVVTVTIDPLGNPGAADTFTITNAANTKVTFNPSDGNGGSEILLTADPVITTPGGVQITQGFTTPLSGVSVTDLGAPSATVTATLSDTTGLLSATATGGAAVSGSGTTTLTVSGSLTQVNAALATLTDTNQTISTDAITVTAADSAGDSAAPQTLNTFVIAPIVIATPTQQYVTQNTSTALSYAEVYEQGALNGADLTVTLSDTSGLLSATGNGVSGSGTTHLTITGSQTLVNADLATVTVNEPNQGSDTITVSAQDAAGDMAQSTSTTITTYPPPTTSAPATAAITQNSITPLSGISVSDTAAPAGSFSVTLSDTSDLLSTTGNGLGTTSITFAGSLAQINADLAALTIDAPNAGADTVNVTATDAAGGTSSQNIAVTATHVPAPDLTVSAITAPSTGIEGQTVQLTWTVTNSGDATATGPWTDNVYLASDAGGNNKTLVGSFSYTGTLTAGQSETETQTVVVPAGFAISSQTGTATTYFVVQADANNQTGALSGLQNHITVATAPTATTQTINWKQVLDSIQPAGFDSTDYALFEQRFIAEVGTTDASYSAAIASTIAALDASGTPSATYSDAVGVLIQQAGGGFGAQQLAQVTDPTASSAGLNALLTPSYNSDLTSRNNSGVFGDGWSSELNDVGALGPMNGLDTQNLNPGSQAYVVEYITTYVDQYGDYLGQSISYQVVAPARYGINFLDPSNPYSNYTQTNANGTIETFSGISGLLVGISDGQGNAITINRNAAGTITSIVTAAGHPPTFTVNAQGNVTSATDTSGNVITYTYDASGTHLLNTTNSAGTTSYQYSTSTNPFIQNALTQVTSPDGTTQTYTYDAQGDIASQSTNGAAATTFTNTGVNTITRTNADGQATTYTYDANGQPTAVTDAKGNTFTLQYDANGDVTSITTATGQTYHYAYDASGNLTSYTDPLGHTVQQTYTAGTSSVAAVTDQDNNVTQYTYTAAGQVSTVTQANGSGSQYQYNAAGQVSEKIEASGATIQYSYNAAGQVTNEQFSDGTSQSYTYNAAGNLASSTAVGGAVTTYGYNAQGLLASVTNAAGQVESYSYNAAGQETQRVEPDGSITNYAYNTAGQLASITDGSGATIATYTYDAAGALTGKTTGNGSSTIYSHDASGNLTEIKTLASDGTTTSKIDYTYDADSRITTATSGDGTWTYTYDASNQLSHAVFASTNVAIASQDLTYEYDAAGNRTQTIFNGATTNYTTNNLNQYTSANGTTYGYDANGNLITKTSGGSTTTYTYNFQNQLTSSTDATGTTTYAYDALGNIAGQTVNGVATTYVTDPLAIYSSATGPLSAVAQAYNAAGQATATYTYGNGLTAVTSSGTTSYYNADASGNITSLSGANGALTQTYDYTPSGTLLNSTGSVANPFQFNGLSGAITQANGLVNTRARYYDPTTGRFVSQDPSGQAGGVNLYTYAANNSISYIDADGNSISPSGVIVAGAGVILSVLAGFAAFATAPVAAVVLATGGVIVGGRSYYQAFNHPGGPTDIYVDSNSEIFSNVVQTGVSIIPGGKVLGTAQLTFSALSTTELYDPNGATDYYTGKTVNTTVTVNRPKGGGHGDVHLTTFDGLNFDFQAVGEFVLAKSTAPGDNFQVQVRLSALGGGESSPTLTTEIGIQVGNQVVTFAADRTSTVYVDGAAAGLSTSANTLTLAGGTISQLSQNSYQVTEKTGETIDITNNGQYFDYTVDLAPSATPGSVEGLLGTYTGTANAFELPDGTVLGSTLTQTQLYQTFGNAWRITDGTSLLNYLQGETTATYTDLAHPAYALPVASLPTAVVQAATDAAAAAGLTGTAATDAVYDYLATGDPSFITNAANTGAAAPVTATATITAVAPPPPSIGISPSATMVTEISGQTPVTFTVSLTSAATTDTVIDYAESPTAIDTGKTYFGAADFGGTLPSGTVTILAGQTQAQITLEIPDSALGTSPDKWLALGISTPGADPIYASTAQVDILNDAPVAGVAAQPVLEYVPGNTVGVSEIAPALTRSGNGYTLNLGNVVQGTSLAALQFALANMAAAPADGLVTMVTSASGGGASVSGLQTPTLINAGNAYTGLTLQPLTTNLGAQTETVTLGAMDVNNTGYDAALSNITLTVTENIIAAAQATLGTSAVKLPDVRVGSTDTQTITVTNSAAAGAAALDITLGAATGAVATGAISQLAAGAIDSTSLSVGIATTTAGLQTSFVTLNLASDLGGGVETPVALNQSVSVTGAVYRAAAASTTQAAAVVHVGDTGSQDLAILNSDPADGYSEGLRATVTGTTGGISAAGTTGLIAAGATDASSVVVNYATATSGVVSGQVNLGLTSDGTGVDSLAPISLGTDPVAFSVQVDNYATADLKETSGGGTLTGSAATGYDLDLGTLSEGSGAATINLAALNSASGLADLLAGTFGITGDTAAFTNSGFGAFGGLGAGQSGGASSVSLSTANDGTFSETITLTATGSNASGYSGSVAPVTLTIHGEVAESPGTVTHSTTPGTFFGAAFVSSTFSYTAAGRLYLQTFYDASGAVVASETRDANGGYSVTVGGVRVQALTVNADGSSDAYYTGHGTLLGQAYVASDNLHYASGALELQTFYDASGATVATESYSASGGYTITIGGAVAQAKTVNSDGSYDYRTNTAGTVLGTAYAGYDNAYTAAGFRDLETYYNASGTIIAQTTYATNGGYTFTVGGVRVQALTVNSDGSYDAYYTTSGTFLGQAYASSDNLFFASGALEQQTFYNASGAVVATESYTNNGGYTVTIGGSVVQTRTVNSDGSYDIRYGTSGTILGTAYASYDFAYTASGFRDAETFYDGSGTVVGSATFTTNGSYSATFGGVRVLALTVNTDGSYDFYYGTKGTFLGQAYASSDNLHAASGALESQTFYDASGAVVGSETYQANGGHTVTIEGSVVQVQTGYADGSFLIENENVQGQDFTQAYIAFYHPATAIAVSATLDDGGNRSSLAGVGLNWSNIAGVAQVTDGADTFQLGADINSALDITGAANATLAFGKGDGAQIITGFATSGGGADALSFSQSVFADYAHLMGATQQQGSDLLITLDANDTLLLKNVSMSSFTSANAHFT